MSIEERAEPARSFGLSEESRQRWHARFEHFPWWLAGMGVLAVLVFVLITTDPDFNQAFSIIRAGLTVTILTTIIAFAVAILFGLVTGLGRISNNVLFRNLATFYVELIRGIPMLVLIFFIALVAIPGFVRGLNALGAMMLEAGFGSLATPFISLEISQVDMNLRAIIALSTTYGAFLAEIFRAGIQSIPKGQMEAARSQGMSYTQAMRYVILPQAIRNILPALGNDFVSMLKDSSLVSVLAVRDITQIARLYAGRSFKFPEAFSILAVMYLAMTVALSFLVKAMEKRMRQNER
ncbi:MAG: amino acid ABC transporter permease [Anaerolineae bacterium]|nr:amino acid ABC transporter permease [Anaerolineae bacterium]